MAKGILHLHVTVVILFLILLLVKTVLLFINQPATLQKLRDKTKVLDMIFGTLIILTGAYLVYVTRFETYILVKVVITLVGIPLGIIAFKKSNKVLAALSLFAFVYVYGVAETNSWKMKPDQITLGDGHEGKEVSSEILTERAVKIFKTECAACHGEDGKLGVGGAKDLTASPLSEEEMVNVIKNGRGLMPAYQKRLGEDEINALAKYVKALKK